MSSSRSSLWKVKPEGDGACCILQTYLLPGDQLKVIRGSAM
ncbi:MAG TPA: hypothetical protein VGK96_06165 [Candidatus Sulfotelmatobacter sp.]